MSLSLRFLNKPRRALVPVACLLAIAVTLGGCDLFKNDLKIDRSGNKEFQDYRDAMAPRPVPTEDPKKSSDAGIPGLQSYVVKPSDNLKAMPLVSISINQTVPLRDALFELAKQANYDVELDPRINGSIIFTARNQPFDTVIQRISDTAGLRYKFDGNVLRVEIDSPYHDTYKIDYLSYVRKTTSSVTNNSSLAQAGGTSAGAGGTAAGSQFTASSESEANFWGELQTNLQQILGVPLGAGFMRTESDPQITAVASNPPPVATTAPVTTGAPAAGGTPAGTAPTGAGGTAPVAAAAPAGAAPQPPNATLQVSSLPPTDAGGAATAAAASSTTPSFSINKQAGIVSVYATEKQHEQIREYLKLLRRASTAQVLIEAKVMEVNLTDEFATGINWGLLDVLSHHRFNFALTGAGYGLDPNVTPVTQAFSTSLTNEDGDQNALVSAIQRFGTVKALASPRLTVLNNQSAVLNVANNQVYFTLQVNSTTDNGVTQTTINSTAHNIPEGILINVQPSIDLDRKSISMSIRPTITRQINQVSDPAVSYLRATTPIVNGTLIPESFIPVVNVQEMDSVININSGQAVVMGGLMQDRTDSHQTGIPVASEIPLIGGLFRGQGDQITKTELVIFMTATIIDDGGARADDTDKDLYKTFSDDRRPLKL